MIRFKLLIPALLISLKFFGQTISGIVLDETDRQPLVYASLGVVGTTLGTITNDKGVFYFENKNLAVNSIIRISMVGYRTREFTIDQIQKRDTIHLHRKVYNLPEIRINPNNKLLDVGITAYSFRRGFCGWGGNDFGKGLEIGTKIDLGNSPKKIKSIHVRINKQSFDSSLFRIHIRDIENGLPKNELLKSNILVSITNESGWFTADLSRYNLVFESEISLTLEWIKVYGLNEGNLINSKGTTRNYPGVTINIKQNKGLTYAKWGTEANWTSNDMYSPSIYLTVQ